MKVAMGIIYEKIRLDAKRSNAKKLEEAIARLLKEHDYVNIVVLPAYPFTGPLSVYDQSKVRRFVWNNAERITTNIARLKHSSTASIIARWSSEYKVFIVGGPIIERAGPKIYLTVIATSPEGEIIGRYRKVSLSRHEEEAGISSGKLPGLIRFDKLDTTIGVFVEDDIAYPELFRVMQLGGANLVLGFALPYQSPFLGGIKQVGPNTFSMDLETEASFLLTRSKETGLPIILVGGAVETSGSREKLYVMPIIPVEPDTGVIKDKIRGVDDLGTSVIVEIDTAISKPRSIGFIDQIALKMTCKAVEKGGEEELLDVRS
jgi:predicted amidohydrolase